MLLKRGIVVAIIVLVVVIAAASVWYIHNNKSIQFVEIASFDTGQVLTREEKVVWFSLRHESYNGFFSAELLNNYGVETEHMTFDFENYTYIITVGHELRGVEFSYSVFKNRKYFILPDQFVGKVTLDDNLVNRVFFYRVRRMNIDLDYHSPRSHVTFS